MRVAVVGVGIMGKNHARIYSNLKNIELVAVCDSNNKLGKEVAEQYRVPFYNNHQALLKNVKFEAASIVVPTILHKKIALDFIKHKINILVEKPLAHTSAAAMDIVKAAKKNKVKLLVGHIERYNPATMRLLDLIKKKYFGNIISINSTRVGLFPPHISDVGVVTDLAVHDMDIISKIAGKQPSRVFAVGGSTFINTHHDHAEIILDYGSFSGFIQVNWTTPVKIRRLTVTGTKGYAELNYISQKLSVYERKYKVLTPKKFSEFVIKFGEPHKKRIRINKKEPLRMEIQNFVDSISGKTKLKVTGEEGVEAVKLADRVISSVKTGRVA